MAQAYALALAVPTLHLVINTAVYETTKKIDKKIGQEIGDAEKQDIIDYILNPETKTALIKRLKWRHDGA